MDKDEAKTILSAFRPGGDDAGDPVFAEALALAARDPDLAGWLEEERAFDLRAADALRTVRPPEALRARILAAAPAPRAYLPRAGWLAAAAAVLLAGFAAVFLAPGKVSLAEVGAEVARLQRENRIELGVLTGDHARVRRWLADHRGPLGFTVPAPLEGRPALGCQVLQIRGNRIAIVCFALDGGGEVHLVIVERRSMADPPPVGTPVFWEEDGIGFASWSDRGHAYLLTGAMSAESLREWL